LKAHATGLAIGKNTSLLCMLDWIEMERDLVLLVVTSSLWKDYSHQ